MPFLQNELLYAEVEYMQKRVSIQQSPLAVVPFFLLAPNYMWRSFCFQEMDLQSDNMYLRSKVNTVVALVHLSKSSKALIF